MLETAQPQAGTANQPEEIDTQAAELSETSESENAQGGSPETGERDIQDEPFMTIRYNKEDKPLTRDEAAVYAQKGMNYDKLSERLKDLSARLSGYENGYIKAEGEPRNEEARQALINYQLDDFMSKNPGTDPRKLPESVIGEWKKGVPLTEAYFRNQTQELSEKINEMREAAAKSEVNRKNEAAGMGRASEGAARAKAISEDSIRNMSPEELDRNHERIWAFITGK
jgi:hypothetical protein